ncbi:MAG TPA: S-methyl-5'-thioadenosine phosphorylase [Thermomicrobiales bacterium]|nr:S-methyl-5'-thioadenosine phosphorylase [Thermomicrobiales bacterium]
MLGVIGGSGVYDLPGLEIETDGEPETPFGRPSGPVRVGRLGETRLAFIARHGPGHRWSPTNLPYRANVYALKDLGVTRLLSVSAVGSLREALPPRSLVLPDQIIDRTVSRPRTFFDGAIVAHVGLADPYCSAFRAVISDAATALDHRLEMGGTYLCIEGPQFSTRAESNLYRAWNASVIGMTAMPEARLAREAELCYATLALVTDYDVWHEAEADVSVQMVIEHLRANSLAASEIITRLAAQGVPALSCRCGDALKDAVMTTPVAASAADWDRLGVIGDRYRPSSDD